MCAGIQIIVKHGLIDGGKGGAYTFWHNGVPDDQGLERNRQNLSYVMLSLTYNYYQTKDSSLLPQIDNLRLYILMPAPIVLIRVTRRRV